MSAILSHDLREFHDFLNRVIREFVANLIQSVALVEIR